MVAKRRVNGEGSIRKRRDGRREGRCTAGCTPAIGKTIYKNGLGRLQNTYLGGRKTAPLYSRDKAA